jgi:hypothetical protein
MNIMKKNTALYILLVFLIVINGFFLINYLGKPSHKIPKGNQDNFIVKELKFDDAQKKKFEALEEKHFKRIESIIEDEKMLKDELFDMVLNDTINASEIDSITNQIGVIITSRELETFNHFRAIQDLCNEKQKDQFKQILRHALRGKRNNGQAPPRPDRRREGDGPPPKRH